MSVSVPSDCPLALVAEDEPLILMETVDLLIDRGFAVLEAYNAAQALEQLAAHPGVRLLVSDVQMPGAMKGFELAREAHQRYPMLSIIVCSGRVRPAPGELPPTAVFIDKPLSAAVLESGLRGFTLGASARAC